MECAHFQPQLRRHESGQQQGEHRLLHTGEQTRLCTLGSAPHGSPQFRCMGQEMGKQVKKQEMGLLGMLPWR